MAAARIRLVARLGGTGSELSPWVIGSMAAHAVFIGAMVLLPALRPSKPFPDNPIVVDLVGAAGPPAAQAAAAPPPPEPDAPPAEGVRLETREPPPVKPLPEKDPPKPRKKDPEPKPRPPANRDTAPSDTATAASGPHGPGVEGSGATVSALEGGDARFAWYRDSVTAALYTNWRRPILEGLTAPVEVRITFEIARDGSVSRVRIDQPSGISTFDRSALRAVTDAAPLAPLPPAWREATLPAAFVFKLFPD